MLHTFHVTSNRICFGQRQVPNAELIIPHLHHGYIRWDLELLCYLEKKMKFALHQILLISLSEQWPK